MTRVLSIVGRSGWIVALLAFGYSAGMYHTRMMFTPTTQRAIAQAKQATALAEENIAKRKEAIDLCQRWEELAGIRQMKIKVLEMQLERLETPPKMPPLRTARIVAVVRDKDGKTVEAWISSDDEDTSGVKWPQKFDWYEFGGKKVSFDEWFTWGEAREFGDDKRRYEWKKRTPGIYKMDYSSPLIKDVFFKGMEVKLPGEKQELNDEDHK